MKQFRFKLQVVLEFRARQVDLIQLKVSREEKIHRDIALRIQACEDGIQQAVKEYGELLGGSSLNLTGAQGFSEYLRRLKEEKSRERQALAQHEKVLLAAREELKQALIKKKSLEILKEKEQERFLKKVEKAEEAFLEEMALNRSRAHRRVDRRD